MATVAALRVIGARNVAVGAPYPDSVTERFARFLEDSGFGVVHWAALQMTTEWEIGNASPSVWRRLAQDVDRPQADAVVLGCTGIRTAEVLTSLEDELGKPVVSAPQAMIWHPLQLMGVDATRGDRGVLFADYGAAYATHASAVGAC